MPTKRARFCSTRSEWLPDGRTFTPAENRQLRRLCAAPAFRRDVLELARLHDEGRRVARVAMETPAEAALALRALHADALAIAADPGELPRRVRFLERLDGLSTTATAFLHVGALRAGLRRVEPLDIGAADTATREKWAATLAAGVDVADAAKGPAVQRGATLERGTAEKLAAIFARYGLPFTASNRPTARGSVAVAVLALVMPGHSHASLTRYALHAMRSRGRAG
jgi:hypothetical protein